MRLFSQSYFAPNTVESGYVSDSIPPISRLYAQYRNKSKAVSWYNITLKLAEQINSASQAVRVMYNIDSAYGDQLDILGKIVVIPRNFLGTVPLNPGFFATLDNDPGEFGDDSCMFSALSLDQDSQMSDDLYRLAIKSKIIKNNSSATIEDILHGVNFLLPDADILRVTDNEDMSFSVEFYGNITPLQRWALLNASLIPKPQGVKFNGFLEGIDYVEFGNSNEQFGDSNSQFTGFTGV